MTRPCKAAIVDHPDFLLYDFGSYHPLRPERIVAGLDLLETAGLWSRESERIDSPVAALSELETVHDSSYIRAVDEAGTTYLPHGELARYGLTKRDNPPFPAMHYAAALVAGGTAEGVRRVLKDACDHVFNPAGGLHHALRAQAAGFCIYNDPAVAAALAARSFDARVAYVDFDCHHGDGVQWIFYRDPTVLTVSFHETGRFLFPGTGEVTEIGEGPGHGFSVNVPFAPFTRDQQWMEAADAVVPAVVGRFKPDLLITNHGCDTHAWDPQTHLSLTTAAFAHQAAMSHRLAHEHCEGRWIAVGSGGYDWRRVVPRSWSILWSEMTGRSLPERLPTEWIERWKGDDEMPSFFLDDEALVQAPSRAGEIERFNRETLAEAQAIHHLR